MKQHRLAGSSSEAPCGQFESLASDYLDECLSSAESAQFLAHLEQCQNCTKLLQEMEFLREMARSLAFREIPQGVQQRLRARLAAEVGFRQTNPSASLRVIK